MAKMRDMESRSKAAKGLKGKGAPPAPPMEEELPMDAGAPPMGPEAGIPPSPDMGAVGTELPPELAALAGSPEGGAPPTGPQSLEDALLGVEASLADLPPEKAEEVRVHLNAIRDVVGAEGVETGPPAGADAGGMTPPIGEEEIPLA